MSVPKVMGTEVEYGITVKGDPDFDPISSCVLLVNAYREDHAGEILWDYDQENPLADARGFQVDGEKYTPNQQENIARNKTLENGARYYVDHAHPEYSCPEVTNPHELVVHEKAGERIFLVVVPEDLRRALLAIRVHEQHAARDRIEVPVVLDRDPVLDLGSHHLGNRHCRSARCPGKTRDRVRRGSTLQVLA